MADLELPAGVLAGHWTAEDGLTGCSVVLVPDGATGGVEVRGGGPGTRETDVLAPSSMPRDVHGVVLSGGSAFGLATGDGVVAWLEERGHGHLTRAGVRVPLVAGAVVFDRSALEPGRRPGAAEGRTACDAAGPAVPARGRVGAGASTAAGKLADPGSWAWTGFGAATERIGGALVTALAVANPVGDVLDADGSLLAAGRRDGELVRTADLLRAAAAAPPPPTRENTVLVVVCTDARVDRTGAWLVARAASAGVARAVDPVATSYDGDVAFCLSTGTVEVDPFALGAAAAWAAADAVRDAARSA
ncbi:P1 family peptidase [Conexibacter sp. SYSU D00693]|uniref:P1 family peptidase n=1 Tax=Conexibacter sp. SYSU D00693 TaxID=2812560 RepID=UPI00196AE391|nr:P1 family peptidase [Conexibacter sp. SYSU D00693]